jgi:hypothetical protein
MKSTPPLTLTCINGEGAVEETRVHLGTVPGKPAPVHRRTRGFEVASPRETQRMDAITGNIRTLAFLPSFFLTICEGLDNRGDDEHKLSNREWVRINSIHLQDRAAPRGLSSFLFGKHWALPLAKPSDSHLNGRPAGRRPHPVATTGCKFLSPHPAETRRSTDPSLTSPLAHAHGGTAVLQTL